MPFLPYTTGCLYGALLNFVSSVLFVIISFPDLDKDLRILSIGFGLSMPAQIAATVADDCRSLGHIGRVGFSLTIQELSAFLVGN